MAYLTLSGILDTDYVGYNAQHIDFNVGQNKAILSPLGIFLALILL